MKIFRLVFFLSVFVLICFWGTFEASAQGDEGSCFLPGTPIQMFDGSVKAIEDVEVGEVIVGYDIVNKKFTRNVVEELENPIRESWFKIFLENGKVLRTTDDHPIYVKEYDDWASIDPEATWKNSDYQMRTQQLKIGQQVMDLNENFFRIKYILEIPEKVQTYNFKKVSNNNTFFAEGTLVHNKTICYLKPPTWVDNEYDARYTAYDSSWSSCNASCDGTGTQTKSWTCDYCGDVCPGGIDCADCKNNLRFNWSGIIFTTNPLGVKQSIPYKVKESPSGSGLYKTTLSYTCSGSACPPSTPPSTPDPTPNPTPDPSPTPTPSPNPSPSPNPVNYSCTGSKPSNSWLCSGDASGLTSNVARSLVKSCSPYKKCEYTCKSGYVKSGNSCIADSCTPDCSCASSTCSGNTCSDGCGGTCNGTGGCYKPGYPTDEYSCSSNILTTKTKFYTYPCVSGSCGSKTLVSTTTTTESCDSGETCNDGISKSRCKDEATVESYKEYIEGVCNNSQGCLKTTAECQNTDEICEPGYICRETGSDQAECVPKSTNWTEI